MKKMLLACLIVSGVSLAPAWAVQDNQEPICDSPAVIFCDNFEARAVGSGDFARHTYKNFGWGNASSFVVTANSNGVFSGSRGFEVMYPAGANVGAGFMRGRFANASDQAVSAPDIYTRWYVKWSSNFVFSAISNKHLKSALLSGNDQHLMQRINDSDIVTVPGGITPPWYTAGGGPNNADTYNLFQETNPITFQRNQWYCIEAHTKVNSASAVADGIIEIWVNGVQRMSYSSLNMERTAASALRAYDSFFNDGYWNCTNAQQDPGSNACNPANAESTHPLQYRWHDNFVASTQRIGCLNGPPPPPSDVNPPAAPSGLRISSLFGPG